MKIGLFLLLLISLPAWTETNPAAKEPATSILEGQVVKDPGGIPVKKAEVQLIAEGQQEEGKTYTGTTDADGHFRIEGIQAGRYRAFVERVGLVEIDKRHRRSPGRALSFEPGKDISDLVLRMLPAAVVVGKVVDEDGDPMPRTDVSVLRYGYTLGERHLETAASGTTNDLGEYRIPDLLPGRYLVAVNPTPDFSNLAAVPAARTGAEQKQETAYVPTYYPGTTDRSQAAFLELRAGDETPVNFSLVLSPTFHVRGSVANFPPNSPGILMLRPQGLDAEFAAAQVDKDGKFDIPHLAPGSYMLIATIGRPKTSQITWQPLEVRNHDLNDVRIIPISRSELRGQVRVDGKQAMDLSSLLILLRSNDHESTGMFGAAGEGSPTLTQVKRDGAFELKKVPPGVYSVLVEGSTRLPDFYLKSVKAGSTDVTNSGLSLGGGGTYSLDVLIGAGAAKLDGVVINADGHPVADAVVVAVPSGEHSARLDLYEKAVTDQHGRFNLNGITPGDYRVFAFESLEEGAYFDRSFLKPFEASSESLHLDENGRKTLQMKVILSAEDEP
jgi:protocatechuate 3,4-dioxygenase beta subunit